MNEAPQPQVNSLKLFEFVFNSLSIICWLPFVDIIVFCACPNIQQLLHAKIKKKIEKIVNFEIFLRSFFSSFHGKR